MSQPIHITLMGSDDVLAAILAEQAVGKAGFAFSYDAAAVMPPENADVVFWSGHKPSDTRQENKLHVLVLAKDATAPFKSAAMVFHKPLRLAMLLDTIIARAKLQRIKQPHALANNVLFHPFTRTIETTGQTILLSEKEAHFLHTILESGSEGLSRQRAITDIWGYHPDVDSHAVDQALYRLRQKLQEIEGFANALSNDGGIYRWALNL